MFVSKDLTKLSNKELIEYINELRKQLNNEKYGLYFDRKATPEEIVEKCKKEISVLDAVNELSIINGDKENILIEGDNYQILSILNYFGNDNLVDLIYIDPPYNTGNNDFIYEDKFVDVEDGFRHTKWLNFMEKRLKLARNLLKDDGLIFISIDDNEQANLEILMNSIFGESNKITKFIWEKTQHFGRQKINYYSNAEYIMCYAKNKYSSKMKELLVEKINNDLLDAPLYNGSNPVNTLVFPKGSVKFNIKDGNYLKTKSDLYILESPVIVKDGVNANPLILTFRSRWSPEKVLTEYEKGTTYWVKTETFAIRTIYHEDKVSLTSPKQLIFTNSKNPLVAKSNNEIKPGVNEEASRELSNILPNNPFSYPKPVSLIKYLIDLYYDYKNEEFNKDIVVMDFFAGSGTTGQAVLELNELDGGNRRFILATNNENNIMTEVCYPRLKTIITGEREDGTKYSDGLKANLRYFRTSFMETTLSGDQDKYNLVERCDGLLNIKENIFDKADSGTNFNIYLNKEDNRAMGIYNNYYETNSFEEMLLKIKNLNMANNIIYYFSLDNNVDEALEKLVKKAISNVDVKPIPSKIYEIYRKISEDLKREY